MNNHTSGPTSKSIGGQVEGTQAGFGADGGPAKGVDAPVSETNPALNGVKATGDLPKEIDSNSGEL